MSDKKINVKISNWLGEVCFESTQSAINEFNDYFEWSEELQLNEGNNYNIDSYGMLFEEPYLTLDPIGKFVIVSEYNIFGGDLVNGYLFEFFNCDCPAELEKYLYDDWIFVDEFQELVKYSDNKYEEVNEIIDAGSYEIDNKGTGCLRFSDFNYNKFLEIIGAKEPGSDKLYNDILNDNGLNEIYYENGQLKERFNKINGKKNGIERFYYKDGTLKKEENWENGKENGLTRWFDKNGNLEQESNWKDGKLNGQLKSYHKNGKLKEDSIWKDGKRNGLDKSYNENGLMLDEENFKCGKRNGIAKYYYENGQMKYKTTWKDDKINGLTEYFYENGQIKEISNWKDDKRNGPSKHYYESGQLEIEANFKDDKKDGVIKSYYENGQLCEESKWKDDQRINED